MHANLERGNIRGEKKKKKKKDHYTISLFGMGFEISSPICLKDRTAATPILKQQILAVSSGEMRGRVYIRTSAWPLDRGKGTRYQFEAAYQNNGYIFINIWPTPSPPRDKREISMEMRVEKRWLPRGRPKRISSRPLFRTGRWMINANLGRMEGWQVLDR